MASELRVNTLKDAAGNNSIATSFVAEGSSKCWVNFNGSGTVTIQKSHNTSSITDSGTGQYVININSDMDSADYVINITGNNWAQVASVGGAGGSLLAGTAAIRFRDGSATYTDMSISMASIQGDLA